MVENNSKTALEIAERTVGGFPYAWIVFEICAKI